MTKKHYEAIAAIIKPYAAFGRLGRTGGTDWAAGERCAANGVALELADYFASENSSFDRQRFLAACGVAQ